MWPWLGPSTYMCKCAHVSVCTRVCIGEEPVQVSVCTSEYGHVSVAHLLSSPRDPASHRGATLIPRGLQDSQVPLPVPVGGRPAALQPQLDLVDEEAQIWVVLVVGDGQAQDMLQAIL